MKMRTSLMTVLAALALSCAVAAASEIPVKIDEKTLENGLKIVAVRMKGAPHAACGIGVRSGSGREIPGGTGLAHFLEHMMFKGTDKLGVKDFAKDQEIARRIDALVGRIEAASGSPDPDRAAIDVLIADKQKLFKEEQENLIHDHIDKIYEEAGSLMTNAFTSEDSTVYFTLLPHAKIELFFWIESERFRRPVFRQFHSEKDVVREERRLSENQEGNAFNEEMNRAIWGSHPYAHPVIGSHDDLVRMTRHDLQSYFEANYSPDNMFLLIGADADAAGVFALAEKYFGGLRNRGAARRRVPDFAPQNAAASRVYGKGSGTPYFGIAYKTARASVGTETALDMIGLSLSDAEGKLHANLVDGSGTATSIRAYFRAMRHGGVFWVDVGIAPGQDPLQAEPVVLAAISALASGPLQDEEVRALRRKHRASILGAFKDEMSTGFTLLSREVLGSWRDIDAMLDAASKITAEDLRKAAAEHLVPGNSVTGVFDSGKEVIAKPAETPAHATVDEPAPAPGATRTWKDLEFPEKPLVIPDPAKHLAKLGNGIRVVMVEDPNDPVFRIEALFAGGESEVPAAKSGLMWLLSSVANRSGTAAMTRKELDEKLEDYVASFSVSGGSLSLRFQIDGFSKDKEALTALLAELMRGIELDQARFQSEKDSIKSSIIESETDPESVSSDKIYDLAWMGALRARRATVESIDSVSFGDVAAALARHRSPRRCMLAVSGDFDRKAMTELLDKTFGGWREAEGPLPKLEQGALEPQGPGMHLVEFDTTQGFVNLAARIPSGASAEYPAITVLQAILSERLYKVIRSEEGLAYDASSWVARDWRLPSLFMVGFQTKCESVPYALSLAFGEMAKLGAEGPAEKEVADAVRRIESGMTARIGKGRDLCSAMLDLFFEPGASVESWRAYMDNVRRCTAADVKAAAAKHLKREAFSIVCVGSIEAVKKGDGVHPVTLADFGPQKVLEHKRHESGQAGPRETAARVMKLICAGDIEGLKTHLTAELAAELTGGDADIEGMAAALSGANFTVSAVSESGDAAQVEVKIDVDMGGQKMSLVLAFEMKRADGKWLVSGIEEK